MLRIETKISEQRKAGRCFIAKAQRELRTITIIIVITSIIG